MPVVFDIPGVNPLGCEGERLLVREPVRSSLRVGGHLAACLPSGSEERAAVFESQCVSALSGWILSAKGRGSCSAWD